ELVELAVVLKVLKVKLPVVLEELAALAAVLKVRLLEALVVLMVVRPPAALAVLEVVRPDAIPRFARGLNKQRRGHVVPLLKGSSLL
ncbi:hypothetical protein LOY97_005379, partial [Ophidiomyces ophidiicola]